jgi:hypothetical protein
MLAETQRASARTESLPLVGRRHASPLQGLLAGERHERREHGVVEVPPAFVPLTSDAGWRAFKTLLASLTPGGAASEYEQHEGFGDRGWYERRISGVHRPGDAPVVEHLGLALQREVGDVSLEVSKETYAIGLATTEAGPERELWWVVADADADTSVEARRAQGLDRVSILGRELRLTCAFEPLVTAYRFA